MVVVDLPGMFLHAISDEDVIMYTRGRLEKLMSMMSPQTCRKYIAI